MVCVAPDSIRILLVEDDGDSASAMKRLLGVMGHSVQAASSVSDARATARGSSFDLLICDILLPDGSGLDLIKLLRDDGHAAIKGIAISGLTREDDIRRSHDAGFSEHLSKPVNIQRLESAISGLVMSRAAEPDAY